jgi:hypothetical protein
VVSGGAVWLETLILAEYSITIRILRNVFLTTAGNVNQQVEIRAITEATGYNTGRLSVAERVWLVIYMLKLMLELRIYECKWKYRYLRKCGINSKTSVQTVTVQSSTVYEFLTRC